MYAALLQPVKINNDVLHEITKSMHNIRLSSISFHCPKYVAQVYFNIRLIDLG